MEATGRSSWGASHPAPGPQQKASSHGPWASFFLKIEAGPLPTVPHGPESGHGAAPCVVPRPSRKDPFSAEFIDWNRTALLVEMQQPILPGQDLHCHPCVLWLTFPSSTPF